MLFGGGRCDALQQQVDTAGLHVMYENREFGRIIELLDEQGWGPEDNPEQLVFYCAAQVALAPRACRCSLSEGPDSIAQSFAHALCDLWSGRSSKAREVFLGLMDRQGWRKWGWLGLFLVAEYTEDYVSLGRLIREYRSTEVVVSV